MFNMLKLDIIVHPTYSEPHIPQPETKKKLGKKWKWPWRINMLSLPKLPVSKYVTPPPEVFKIYGPVEPGIEFRSDHLARPPLRVLNTNLHMYSGHGHKYVKNVTKSLHKTWGSIYNFYRKQLRDKRLKRLRRKMERLKAKKPKGKSLEKIVAFKKQHLTKLAQPKKLFPPPKIVRKWKSLDDLAATIDVLAAPKEHHIVPPRPIGVVNPKALTYEITDTIMKLYHIPDRLKKQPEPPPLGTVKKSALRAKCL